MTDASGALALASHIARLSIDELRMLISNRYIAQPDRVQDALSLAQQLTKAESLSRALRQLHREHIALLQKANVAEISERDIEYFTKLGLIGIDSHSSELMVLPEVREGVKNVQLGKPVLQQRLATESIDETAWPLTAIAAARRASEIIRVVGKHSVRLGAKANLTQASIRQVAQMVKISEESVSHLTPLVIDPTLLVPVQQPTGAYRLVRAREADQWLSRSLAERWVSLVQKCLDAISAAFRREIFAQEMNVNAAVSSLNSSYPLLASASLEAAHLHSHTLHEIGATSNGQLTPAAVAIFNGDPHAALEIMKRVEPEHVTGVYVQPDLSVVVAGPTLPHIEQQLSQITNPEHIGVTCTLRISIASLTEAAHSISIQEIRTFLSEISISPLPQPLEFTLNDLEHKQRMNPGKPHPEQSMNAQPSHSTAKLGEEALHRSVDSADVLAQRVFASSQGEHTDVTRRLELAIQLKSQVQVTAVAGSDTRNFVLTPVSIRDGRLRASDTHAGVERTLPLSAIVSVDAA